MYSLLIKDILVQKKQFFLSLFLVVLYTLLFSNMGGAILSVFALPYLLVITTVAYDDKDKAEVVLNSLPIDRSLIVMERYISVFLFAAIGIIEYTFVEVIADFLKIPIAMDPLTIKSIGGILLGITIYYGIYLPLLFKLGYMKTKWINFVMFFVLFFGITSLINIFIKYKADVKYIDKIIMFLNNGPHLEVFGILIVISFIIYMCSYLLSVRFYRNRGF